LVCTALSKILLPIGSSVTDFAVRRRQKGRYFSAVQNVA
jgi:hypothetical protein